MYCAAEYRIVQFFLKEQAWDFKDISRLRSTPWAVPQMAATSGTWLCLFGAAPLQSVWEKNFYKFCK